MPKPRAPFVTHVLDLLSPLGAVRARAMFGGWGIYRDDRMFALIADDALYFKADSLSEDRFAAAGSEPFVSQSKGRPVRLSYWRCPEAAMDDPDAILAFARLGVDAAMRSAVSKRH